MIARGDLGIEVPIECIPGIQRKIIQKCVRKHKPVIVATQMLHTMINNPRPTRAEVTDIANAIYSNTDALMLSGETASGKYPLEAVRTMASIAEQAEKDRQSFGHAEDIPLMTNCTQKEFLAHAAINATRLLGVEGIITDSETGETARNLASFRGPKPISVYQKEHQNADFMFLAALRMLRQKGYLTDNDKVAYLSGSLGEGGGTTFIEINDVSKAFDEKYQFHLPKV